MPTLSEMVVAFTTQGVEAVRTVIGGMDKQLSELGAAANRVGGVIQQRFATVAAIANQAIKKDLANAVKAATDAMISAIAGTRRLTAAQEALLRTLIGVHAALGQLQQNLIKIRESMMGVATAGKVALGVLTVGIGGFVRSGINASAVGDRLRLVMTQLSLTIAGLFRPEIDAVIDAVRRVTSWIRGLTDSQRENIVNWIKGAAAAALTAILLPKLVSGMILVVGGIRAITAALLGLETGTGFGAWAKLLAIAASAMVGLMVATEKGRGVISALLEPLKNLWDTLTGLSKETVKLTIEIIAGVAAFATFVIIAPKVVTAIGLMITAIKSLSKAMAIAKAMALAMSGPLGWVQLAIGITAGTLAVGLIGNLMMRSMRKLTGPRPGAARPWLRRWAVRNLWMQPGSELQKRVSRGVQLMPSS